MFGGPLLGQEVVIESYCEHCHVVDPVGCVDDIEFPVDYSLENIPTRCADYLFVGVDTYFEYDSDGDIHPALRDSSSEKKEKQSEEKFVRRVSAEH